MSRPDAQDNSPVPSSKVVFYFEEMQVKPELMPVCAGSVHSATCRGQQREAGHAVCSTCLQRQGHEHDLK